MSVLNYQGLKKKLHIADFIAYHLEKTDDGGYVCPYCGSGTGRHGTGGLYPMPDGEHCFCHACHTSGDAFDLACAIKGLNTPTEAYNYVSDWLDLHCGGTVFAKRQEQRSETDYSTGREAELGLVESWRNNIDDPEAIEYLTERGVSSEMARRHGLGYDPDRRRIVLSVPGASYYHVDRAIDDDVAPKYTKPKRSLVGPAPLWNQGALGCDHFVVVEGPFDAMAVEECGHPAVALTGTGCSLLIKTIGEHGYGGTVFILLDDDDAGQTATESLRGELNRLGVLNCTIAMTPAGPDGSTPKDPAELFRSEPDGLKKLLDGAAEYAAAAFQSAGSMTPSVESYRQALAEMGCYGSGGAATRLLTLADTRDPVPCGIPTLDSAIGGLPRGVTAAGAASSVGKTALCLQIAAYLIASGFLCLYYSLEMDAGMLVSRIVSSIAYTDGGAIIPSGKIMSSTGRQSLPSSTMAVLDRAVKRFDDEIGDGLIIANPISQPTAAHVEKAASYAHSIAQETGKKGLVVFVDYLQLLAPMDAKCSERTAVDANIIRLQHIAHTYDAPVVAISSLNRAAYFSEVALDSMKESGGIEYGCDLLLGLQPANLASKARDLKKAGEATSIEAAARKAMHDSKLTMVRDVELTVLKNRNGMIPGPIKLDFIPSASTFVDVASDPAGHQAAVAIRDGGSSAAAQSTSAGAWGPGFPPIVGMPSDPHADVA